MDDRLNKLNRKRTNLKICLYGLSYCKDDPRYEDAKAHYQGQLDEVEDEMEEILGYPPPVTVKLQTAVLTGESKLGE